MSAITFSGIGRSALKVSQILRRSLRCFSDATGIISGSDTRQITSHKTEVNGVNLHYEQAGSGSHVVLLIPGALGSTRTDLLPQLENMNRELFTLIALDPRGYGKSIPPDRDWPEDYFRRDMHDAAQLMESQGASRYSVMGWSDGGITALILAATHPDKVDRLVVWGANSFVTKDDLQLYERVRNIDNWSERARAPMIEMYGEKYFRSQWNQWVDAISSYYHTNQGDICKADTDKIQCPTLIVHGDKDPMVPSFHPEYLHQHINGSILHVMEGAKHNLHMKYFREFNAYVEKFLLSS